MTDPHNVPADDLRSIVERAEQIATEKADLAETERNLFAEAKWRGYDTKVLKRLLALRKRKADDVAEEEAILELYKQALASA